MLAKMTSKNQITLPKAVISKLPPSEYYEVEAVNDCIMLTPVRVERGNEGMESIWRKIELQGITEADIDDAVKWARANPVATGK